MKVTQQSELKFVPVVITLETQEEVDILFDLVGRICGGGITRVVTSSMYDGLETLVSEKHHHDKYFKGTVDTLHY